MTAFLRNKLFWMWCCGAVFPVVAFVVLTWLLTEFRIDPLTSRISLLSCYSVGVAACLVATWCGRMSFPLKIFVSAASFVFPIFLYGCLIFLIVLFFGFEAT